MLDVRLHQDAVTGMCLLEAMQAGEAEESHNDGGGILMTTSLDSTISAFDLKSQKQLCTLTMGTGGLHACIMAGQSLLVGCEDSYIYEIDTATLKGASSRVRGHSGAVTGLCVGASHVASVSTDGSLKLWDYGMGGISRTPVREYHDDEAGKKP